ncbi:MAG TPA: aminotransferase class IV [Gaiellaceae bacterium]|nr:aminotransferase class IV [Gaiellaceae bacterium]
MSLLALAVTGRGVVDPDEPVLHADDEALLRGRAAFETLRVYGGRPFRLEAHLDRLEASAARIGLAAIPQEELARTAGEALAAAGRPEVVLRLLWTAGREGGSPVGLALVSPIPSWIEDARARGIRLVPLLGVRASAPWLLGGVKSTSYAVNAAADAEAKRRGADDAVFVDAGGTVLEGTVSNVWWREGSMLLTPSLDLGVLAGVTRAALLELAPGLGYGVEEGVFPLERMAAAEEAFTSSSVREVLPVVELGGRPMARGDAAARLQRALRDLAGVP